MPDPEGPSAPAGIPSRGEIFLAFLTATALGFGGVMPWARRMLVERRRWLTAEEFNNLLALCQFLPGSNVVNLSVAVGARFAGFGGAAAAFVGILGLPVAIVMVMAWAYQRWGGLETVGGALAGVAAAAAGLVIAMAAKMAQPILHKRPVQALPFIVVTFVLIAVLRWPLEWVVLALCPFSVALRWWWK